MQAASTILIAREDFTVSASELDVQSGKADADEVKRHFFCLIRDNRPDVIVLDLSRTNGGGISAIRTIRERCGVPILVVCNKDDQSVTDYRVAGAAEWITTPVDIVQLNSTIQNIIRLTKTDRPELSRKSETYVFSDLILRPAKNMLENKDSISVRLTTAENEVLRYFLQHPWTVFSRDEIARVIYGRHRPISDRAIDNTVNRLRKKLSSVGGEAASQLIKTEFRRGYTLVTDVISIPYGE